MKATVAEVFEAYKQACNTSISVALRGRLDEEAEGAILQLAPVLWQCNAPLELDEAQTRAFQKYKQPVPEKS